LPTPAQFQEFEDFERSHREVPEVAYSVFKRVPKDAHPMDVVRLGVNYVSLFDQDAELGRYSQAEILHKSKILLAQLPNLVANGYRITHGLNPAAPDPGLSYSENFLSMILGERVTDPLKVKVFDASMILYAEHGFNASTFACRVTASTLSDYHSAICSGIGTLKGPLHGGANEQVMYLLQEIGELSRAESVIRDKLAKKEKIMGFGHRLYTKGDSRTAAIKNLGLQLAKAVGNTKWHDMAQVVEDLMIREKNIYPNLDFPSATAYYLLGIPVELYTPLFVASRVTGWSAHLLEQYADNRLIRPSSEYTGPEMRSVIPLARR
jgi:citrate synthase